MALAQAEPRQLYDPAATTIVVVSEADRVRFVRAAVAAANRKDRNYVLSIQRADEGVTAAQRKAYWGMIHRAARAMGEVPMKLHFEIVSMCLPERVPHLLSGEDVTKDLCSEAYIILLAQADAYIGWAAK